MALFELEHANHAQLKAEGRSFTCKGCPERIQKLRRCQEDREDFTEDDGQLWPIYLTPGGNPYSFCPGKATWDQDLNDVYRLMSLAAEISDLHLVHGGLVDQPEWWIEQMSWFLPAYNHHKFYARVRGIVGDERTLKQAQKAAGATHGGNNRSAAHRR